MANLVSDYLDKIAYNRIGQKNQAFSTSTQLSNFMQSWDASKPKWLAMATPADFEKAIRFNPVLNSCVNLLATSSGNANKILLDSVSGEQIEWTDKSPYVQKLKQLFIERPNVLQSYQEFEQEGIYFKKTFGNRFVYMNFALGVKKEIDILDIIALWNLPSQHIKVKTTGKIYDQIDINGIISQYALMNQNPVKNYDPNEIILFNEVNISSKFSSIIGISLLEQLQMPITNTQYAFEAMNVILKHRGMEAIISPTKKDGMGGSMQVTPEEKIEFDNTFKKDYGLLDGQNPYLLSPIPMDVTKTSMNSKDLGIYEEYTSNAMFISNTMRVPPELSKTSPKNATYENQIQAIRRLYENTTIPDVKDSDSYWTSRLNLKKYGIVLSSTWDHIPALADSFKEKSLALNLDSRTAEAAYNNGIISQNQYLNFIGLPPVAGGDNYKTKENEN